MKKLFILLLLVIISSCKSNDRKEIDFSWLTGKWQRIDDQQGNNTYEKWMITMKGNYLGHGYILKNNDTVFQERLSIHPNSKIGKGHNLTWVLQVTGVNESPTIFEIIESSTTSFTAVNLENEFPTHIHYSIVNDTLKAQVYNEETLIDFVFKKQE